MAEQLSIEQRISAAMNPEPMPEAPPPVEVRDMGVPEEIEAAPAPEQFEQAEQAEPVAQIEESEEVEISTLEDLARHLEVDVADLYNVKFPVDIDGDRTELSIGDLKDVARERERVNKAKIEYERKATEWKAQEEAQRQALTKAHHERESMFGAIEQEYLRDYASVDWGALEREDPGRAALARQHFEARRQNLVQMRQHARMELEAKEREFFSQLVAQEHERVKAENAILTEKLPEWRDPTKRQELSGKISAFLTNEGYSEDQIYGRRLPDGQHVGGLSARDILLARDAMAWRELQAKGDVAKRKVVKLGKKVLTSGPRPSSGDMAQRNESTMRAKLRKTGKVEDAAALIQSRLGR